MKKRHCTFWLFGLLLAVSTQTVQLAAMAGIHSNAEQSESHQRLPFASGDTSEKPQNEPAYPLFRNHAERFYPELDAQKATRLSLWMPGLGQAYARNYSKATLFLATELSVFALAGYNIARALHYNAQDGFETGFQDSRIGEFLTPAQARARMRNHTLFGGLFLLTGIGLHVWNIFDAPKTVDAYNNRRFSMQMQQREHGILSFIFTHRF